MVKAYLRYEEAGAFGVVTSPASNVIYDSSGKLLVSGGLETALVWNIRQGSVVTKLTPVATAGAGGLVGRRAEVSYLARCPSSISLIAVGYTDGFIRLWDLVKGSCEVTFSGHKSAVTALRCDSKGTLVASGARDTDVIVWDVVGETGLYRFRGHKDQVTDVAFLERRRCVLSASKDGFVRVWDLRSQACVQVLVGHRAEVWAMDVDPGETRVVTGASDAELRVFAVAGGEEGEEGEGEGEGGARRGQGAGPGAAEGSGDTLQVLRPMGSVRRTVSDRVAMLRYDPGGKLLACQVAGKALELYRVRDSGEAALKAKRRKKRRKEKDAKQGAGAAGDGEADAGGEAAGPSVAAGDELALLQVMRVKHRISSCCFSPAPLKAGVEAVLALSLQNNMIEVHEVLAESSSRVQALEQGGHRGDVRALALSPDGSTLLSTSQHEVKVWNAASGACLRTMASDYGLCALFVPGSKQAVVGTKAGALELFDVAGAQCLASVAAHEGAVWALDARADGGGFASASADKTVKFWDYELLTLEGTPAKQLGIRHTRTHTLEEDVLALKFSPDGKYIAVALLDSTVKVYFADSLKFFVSLYGHKLPVLCLDISSDAALLVTGSADKNAKIWGLDFGDCHRSLFAHADSVMQVKFVRNTHYFFTSGKDRLIKYWDADRFEQLLTLEGHCGEVWALAVSARGDLLVSGAHDRSIRRWERTDEQFFVEEERDKRLDAVFESGLEEGVAAPEEGAGGGEGGTAAMGKQTLETVSAADSILEALDMAEAEVDRQQAWVAEQATKAPGERRDLAPNLLLLGLTPAGYVLRAVAAVRPTDLEQALLAMPFTDAMKLLEFLDEWAQDPTKVELVCRVAALLLRIHFPQLTGTGASRPALVALQQTLRRQVQAQKDLVGTNLAAMGHLKRLLAARSGRPVSSVAAAVAGVRQKLALGRDALLAVNRAERRKAGRERKKRRAEEEAAATGGA